MPGNYNDETCSLDDVVQSVSETADKPLGSDAIDRAWRTHQYLG